MTTEFFTMLKQIYSAAGIPTAIADESLNILWRNSLAEPNRCPLSTDSASCLFENKVPVSGLVFHTEGETIHRFNVLKSQNADDRSVFTLLSTSAATISKLCLLHPILNRM